MKTSTTVYRRGGYDPTKANNNILEQKTVISAGLSSDRSLIPPDGTTFATCHWAGAETSAVWRLNGTSVTETTTLVDGLRVSEIEVVSSTVGTVTVECNGSLLTLEVR